MNIGFTLVRKSIAETNGKGFGFLDRTQFTQVLSAEAGLDRAAVLASQTLSARIIAEVDQGLADPVADASNIAGLDLISDGRLSLRFDTLAIQQASRNAHLDAMKRLDEYLVVAKRLLANERALSHEGRWYRVVDGYVAQKGTQGCAVPIWLNGASGSALQLAGRHADVFEVSPGSLQAVAEQIERVRAAAAQFGRAEKVRFALPIRVTAYEGPASLRLSDDAMLLSGEPGRVARLIVPYMRLGVSEFLVSGLETNAEVADFSWRLAPLLRDTALTSRDTTPDLAAIRYASRGTRWLN